MNMMKLLVASMVALSLNLSVADAQRFDARHSDAHSSQRLDSERPSYQALGYGDQARGSETHGLFAATLLGSTLAAGGTVALTVGGGLIWGEAINCGDSDFACFGVAFGVGTGYVLGAAPFTAFGTWQAGRLAGGRGRYDFALLGATVGTGLGIGATVGLTELLGGDDSLPFTLAVVPVLQIAGSMIGYHLSHLVASATLEEESGPKWAPVLSADAHGGVVGIGGTF